MKKLKSCLLVLIAGFGLTLPTVVESTKLPKNKVITDYHCHLANLFFEARGESEIGMQAVAKVTMNRVLSNRYPDSTCAVVFQRKQFSWTHQQPWHRIEAVMTGAIEKRLSGPDKVAYERAKIIAEKTVNGKLSLPKLKRSLHYHADYVKPKWASEMRPVAKIGTHIFYEPKGKKRAKI